MHRAFAFLVILLLAATSLTSQRSEQRKVRARMRSVARFVNTHDFDRLMKLVSPDYRWSGPKGETADYQAVRRGMRQMFQSRPDLKQVDRIRSVRVKGHTARIRLDRDLFYTDGGKKHHDKVHVFEIWKKIGGNWLSYREWVKN